MGTLCLRMGGESLFIHLQSIFGVNLVLFSFFGLISDCKSSFFHVRICSIVLIVVNEAACMSSPLAK